MSGPYDLVEGGRGLIAGVLVAKLGNGVDAVGPDWGTVSLVVDQEVLLERAGLTDIGHGSLFRVVTASGRPVFGLSEDRLVDPVEAAITISGIAWTLQGAPGEGWSTVSPDAARLWMIILLLSLGASAILSAFQWTSRRQRRAERDLHEAVNALDDGFAIYDSDDRMARAPPFGSNCMTTGDS